MNSYDSSQSSSSDEEEIKLRPLQPLDSNKSLCKVVDILPGKLSVLHIRQNPKKSAVERKDVACQTNISGDIISQELYIDQFGDQLDNLHLNFPNE